MENKINRPDAEAMHRILTQNPDNTVGTILRLAWLEGLKREEIIKLTWANISIDNQQIVLEDRTIPFYEDMETCLRARLLKHNRITPYVVISDKSQEPLKPESVSRLARQALDREGMTDVRLIDLRYDFVIRKLETDEWTYVIRISGLTVQSFHDVYRKYKKVQTFTQNALERENEYKIWRILQEEKGTLAGLALSLSWYMDIQMKDMITLTWDQVDFEKKILRLNEKELAIPQPVLECLLLEKEKRGEDEDPHVLLSKSSRKPLDMPYLSKQLRTVLIRGGIERVSFRSFQHASKKEAEKQKILALAKSKRGLVRQDVMNLLGVSKEIARDRLQELVEEEKLILVFYKYYLPDTVLPKGKMEEAIRIHLEKEGTAALNDLCSLLGLEKRQCSRILKRMVQDNKLNHKGKYYSLPITEDESI